jgi:ribosomal protein L14
MFKRVGNPVSIESVNFKKASTEDVVCPHCKAIVGRKNGRFVKFAGSATVIVEPKKCYCPKCSEPFDIK